MNIKEQIIQIIENTNPNPKQVSAKIKKTPEIMDGIMESFGDTIPEKVYNFLHQGENICQYSNARKFTSLVDGYRNCGKANSCQCTREQVSKNVSSTKSKTTLEEKIATNKKREETNLRVYGVKNTGQTEKAKAAHKELYEDASKVAEIVDKVANTKLEKYGDKNYNNGDQIRETFKNKRQANFWDMY